MFDLASRDSSFLTIGSMSPSPFVGAVFAAAEAREVGGGLERRGDVHVLDEDVVGQSQGGGREADDALDARAHERRRRRPARPRPGTVSTAISMPRSRTSASMRETSTQRTPWISVSVSAGSTSNAATMATDGLLSAKWDEHGVTQVADADQRDLLPHRSVEEVADALDAGVDVVALVGTAGVADDHEVATHLGGADHGVARELVGVDALDAARRGGTAAAADSGSCARRSSSIPRTAPGRWVWSRPVVRYRTNAVNSVTILPLAEAACQHTRAEANTVAHCPSWPTGAPLSCRAYVDLAACSTKWLW